MQYKKFKYYMAASIFLTMVGCENEAGSSSDVQSGAINTPPVAMAFTATNCRDIAPNGGSCTVQVKYNWMSTPPNNSIMLQVYTINKGVESYILGYKNTINSACNSPFTTTPQDCSFTITSLSTTGAPKTVYVAPNYNQTGSSLNNSVNFILGGGF